MSEPPEDTPFVTLAALASHMNMTPPTGTAATTLQEHLDAALEWVGDKVGSLTGAEQAYSVWSSGRMLVLPATHLVAVTEVRDPRGTVVSVQPQKMDLLAGIVEVPRACAGTWTVTASTREHQASVRLAVKIIAAHLYETQRGRGDGSPRDGMFAGGGLETTVPGPRGFAIPTRAAELLAPWLTA